MGRSEGKGASEAGVAGGEEEDTHFKGLDFEDFAFALELAPREGREGGREGSVRGGLVGRIGFYRLRLALQLAPVREGGIEGGREGRKGVNISTCTHPREGVREGGREGGRTRTHRVLTKQAYCNYARSLTSTPTL